MPDHSITLNVPYDLPQETWRKVAEVFETMEGWKGYDAQGCPWWHGREEDANHVFASVEPSGLLLEGVLGDFVWDSWIHEFQSRLTSALGFEVYDAES